MTHADALKVIALLIDLRAGVAATCWWLFLILLVALFKRTH